MKPLFAVLLFQEAETQQVNLEELRAGKPSQQCQQ